MKKEIDKYRARCERLEREKDELSNKKFRSVNGGTGSESMRLQQRIRELETSNEDLLDDKRSAELRVAELERELESRPSSAQTHKVGLSLPIQLIEAVGKLMNTLFFSPFICIPSREGHGGNTGQVSRRRGSHRGTDGRERRTQKGYEADG